MRLVCPVCNREADHRLVEICNGFRLHHCDDCDVVFSDLVTGRASSRRAAARRGTPPTDLGHLTAGARLFLRRKPNTGGLLLDASGGYRCFTERALHDYHVFTLNMAGTSSYSRVSRCASSDNKMELAGSAEPIGAHQTFDVVTLFEMIARVEDPNDILRDIRSLLKPGGVLVLTVPNRTPGGAGLVGKPPGRLSWWTSGAAVRLLDRNGFHVDRLYQWRSGWFGLFENEWGLLTRVCILTAPLIRLLQSKRSVFYKNNPLCTYDETRASAVAGYVLRRLAAVLSIALCPFYTARRRPAPTLYIEARLKT
jgi:SAM-dependent methyltransferase